MLLQALCRCHRHASSIISLLNYLSIWLSILRNCTSKSFHRQLSLLLLFSGNLSLTLLQSFNELSSLRLLNYFLLNIFLLAVYKLYLGKLNLLRGTRRCSWIRYSLANLSWIKITLICVVLTLNLDLPDEELRGILLTESVFVMNSGR